MIAVNLVLIIVGYALFANILAPYVKAHTHVGPGAIGLLCAQVARAVGATVVLVGRSRHAGRLALARALGIPHAVDSESSDVEAVVKSLTGGYGAQPAGVFGASGTFPAQTYQNTNYYVDTVDGRFVLTLSS